LTGNSIEVFLLVYGTLKLLLKVDFESIKIFLLLGGKQELKGFILIFEILNNDIIIF
jgi:hypothetical protein